MQISSTCPYCGVGCGVAVNVSEDGATPLVLASDTHPANFGRLCSKGSALGETVDKRFTPDRLTHPMVAGQVVSWDQAATEIADRIQQSIDQYGPDSVAFYLSGQLLTEDYYVANKLAKGFLGTANVDTNSRLCMSSAVAAYKRAFGSDTVPCNYEDLESAGLIVLIGSNAAWTHPVLYQRMVAAKEANPDMKVVLIDPRMTASADLADLHLPIKPSSDNFVFQGLLNFLISENAIDEDYIAAHTEGFDDVAQIASEFDSKTVANACDISEQDLLQFYSWFKDIRQSISFYSQGINQSATGTDKCNAIINCHLATAKIGYQGAGPFSITGQPNAMGGREVGGLANMLAAHMDFDSESIDRVQRFWQAPNMAQQAGLKAVDMFDAVSRGQIKVIWIMATNPAVSLPNSQFVQKALEECETVIVSDITHTDTSKHADILLPALGWGEKDGTVTNSERRISRQRAFIKAKGVAKADWWALAQVAEKLGFADAFNYSSSADVFDEHAHLTTFENTSVDGRLRDLNLEGLCGLSQQQFDDLSPIQWPVTKQNPNGTARMFEDGSFYTATGKAQFVATRPAFAVAVSKATEHKKMLLNSGRLRDQWHTMTRTGSAPRLTAHDDVAYVQVNPKDALERGLVQNSIAKISNEFGDLAMQVKISDDVRPGQLFSPIHWNQMFASAGTANTVAAPIVDPVSGQPELKAHAVNIEPLLLKNWARVVSSELLAGLDRYPYWSVNRFAQGYVILLGFNSDRQWRDVLNPNDKLDVIEYANPLKRSSSAVICDSTQINGLVFQTDCVSKLPSRTWLIALFESKDIQKASTALRGELDGHDELVCACFGTTRKQIDSSIEQGAASQAELAATFGCGSKCGSCKPELNQFFK